MTTKTKVTVILVTHREIHKIIHALNTYEHSDQMIERLRKKFNNIDEHFDDLSIEMIAEDVDKDCSSKKNY